jgi:hypothetical protein
MDSVNPIMTVIEIRCQDKFGNVIDEFKLDAPDGQDQLKIEGNKLHVPENYTNAIVLDVLPRGDKFEKERVEFLLGNVVENIYTVVLEPVQYKVIFRIGNTDYEATETMNPSAARTKWGAYDYEINNTSRTIYIRVYGKPVMKMNHEHLHTVVERPSLFRSIGRRFPGKRKWLLLLLMLLIGYGIYAGVSKFVYKKTPWPFKAKTFVQTDAPTIVWDEPQEEAEVQAEVEKTPTQNEEMPSNDAQAIDKVADLDCQYDIDYLKLEKRWNEDSLRSEDYKSLFNAFKEGDVDRVIQLKESLFDSVNIQKDFQKIVDGLVKFKEADDQKKLKMSKEELIRLSKHGSFEIGELGYSIHVIGKRN